MGFMNILSPKPALCSALDPAAQPRLEALHHKLEAFYNSAVAKDYFAMADAGNETWGPEWRPQWDLRERITSGASVLDMGCGSAHVCGHLSDLKIQYTGVEWSKKQVEVNRTRWPNAEFFASSLYDVDLGNRQFDFVISLYVVEHVVWPHRLLEQMYKLARPGGQIAIITPAFRHREYLKSFDYGFSRIEFKEKVRRMRFLDLLVHVYQHRIAYPRILRRDFPRGEERGRFLIHLEPICLHGAKYFPDSDAVYLADTQEMLDYFRALGAREVVHWPNLGYLVVEKSGSAKGNSAES